MFINTRSVILLLLSAASLPAQNYKIVNALSGLVLETTNASTAPNAILDQWQWNGGATQQWKIVSVGGGYSYLQNVGSGLVATLYLNGTTNGTLVNQYSWQGWISEQWQIIPQGSSFNEIRSPYSNRVMDVANYSLSNGTYVQQWDWLYGLNQQWSIVPIQDTYQSTSQTSVYYSLNNGGSSVAQSTLDYDYNSQYYYYTQIEAILYDNGVQVGGDTWGIHALARGFGSVLIQRGGYPGHQYDVLSSFHLVTAYKWYQVISNCGSLCNDWYDAYNFDFVSQNPEGTNTPLPGTWVYSAEIISAIAVATQAVSLGTGQDSVRAPGPTTIFDLKFRAFIAPAWVKGEPCSLSNINLAIYAGDNRGFDPYATSYRAHSEGRVSTVTGNWVSTSSRLSPQNPYYSAGSSTRFGPDAIAPDGYTLLRDTVLNDCHYTDSYLAESNSQMFGSVKGGSGSVITNFYGSVNDALSKLGTNTPSLGYNVTYTINTSNPVTPAYTFEYSHKCYPSYEAYIGGQRVYGYLPTYNDVGDITICLAGGLGVTGTTIGTVN